MERDSRENDVSWYSRNPSLLVAAGSIPYPYKPGMVFPLMGNADDPVIPGVMALDWSPYFGHSESTTDPISIAAQELYTKVRAAFSGDLAADAPDFLMYIGALDSIFAYIALLKRLYRSISTYSPDNYALPTAMLATFTSVRRGGTIGQGIIEKLRRDKVRLWQNINELILKTRKFKCPAVMDLFNRHYWLSDNVFADANDPKAQLYVFNLVSVFMMDQLPIDGGTGDEAAGLSMQWLPSLMNQEDPVAVLTAFGDQLISALDQWDSGYTIAGYLQRAFADVPNFEVAELLQGEMLTATYSEEVLTQIENFRPLSLGGMDNAYPVTQIQVTQDVITNQVTSKNTLTWKVGLVPDDPSNAGFKAQAAALNTVGGVAKPVINLRTSAPTVGDTVVASRFIAAATYSAVTTDEDITYTVNFVAATEIPWGLRLCTINNKGLPIIVNLMSDYFFVQGNALDVVDIANMQNSALVAQFDWHPLMRLYFMSSANDATPQCVVTSDVHNPTIIDVRDLENLHKVCIYSEVNAFGI